jgi:phenylacetate-CoA ligase
MAEGKHPDRAAIQALQLKQLRALIGVLSSNKFYKEKLQSAEITSDIASLADFSARCPFTTKQELVADQEKNPPYGTNLTFPLERYTRFHQTSGTTGTPLRWLDTPENWEWMVENWMKIFRAAKVGATDKIYFAFSFGPFIGFWLAFDAGQKIGALCFPGGGLSSGARLKAILENEITVLCCTPTYALRLAEVAAKEKIDLGKSRMRKLIVAGEPGGSIPATRERLEKLWRGAKVFDHHGMTETGPVTYECPKQPGILHVIESAYFAEIINPQTGGKISAKENGELVLTTLGRSGSPLLRYRTGDLVQRVENSSCICGSCELALRGGILGRTDDMFVVRGVNIHPSAIEDVLRRFEEIAEFQASVTTRNYMTELSLRIETKPDCDDPKDLATRIAKELQTIFSLRVPVMVVASGTLPRFEMKAKRWIRE